METMKKIVLSLGACLLIAASFKPVGVKEHVAVQLVQPADTVIFSLIKPTDTLVVDTKEVAKVKINDSAVASHINELYREIKFGKNKVLSKVAFSKAYYGYLNLRSAGKLSNDKDVLSICDFSLASTERRMWVIDLDRRKVLFNTYVAHGKNSGDKFARSFSNANESNKSSLGFYVTGDTYYGKLGRSLRLNGMDRGYNDAALDRSVVIHGSKFVGPKYVAATKKLGRSLGCPAVANEIAQPIINDIKGGTCLFIYYPEKKYMKSTRWLKKKLQSLPQIAAI
jgi:hypothetical protein